MKSRNTISALNSPASSNSRPERRICRVKISPMVTSPPTSSPNHTTPGRVDSELCVRECRASSAAAMWSSNGW